MILHKHHEEEDVKVLAYNPQKCTGAGACEAACAQTWFQVENVAKSSIRIRATNSDLAAEFCTQCGKCIEVCPTEALYYNKQGVVLLKKELCVGCLSCVGFCPHSVMYFAPEEALAFKCVACGQCVKVCPNGALKIVEVNAPSTDVWHLQF